MAYPVNFLWRRSTEWEVPIKIRDAMIDSPACGKKILWLSYVLNKHRNQRFKENQVIFYVKLVT